MINNLKGFRLSKVCNLRHKSKIHVHITENDNIFSRRSNMKTPDYF
jgi:hypothetical protein